MSISFAGFWSALSLQLSRLQPVSFTRYYQCLIRRQCEGGSVEFGLSCKWIEVIPAARLAHSETKIWPEMGDPLMRCASAMMLLFFITDNSLAAETVQPTRLSQPIVLARYSKTISPGIPLISNHRTSVHPLRGELSKVSLTGSWYWRATCAVGSYRGSARIFQQTSDRFAGRLGNTSFYDRGSISDGLLRGRVASFTLSAFGESARIRAVVVGLKRGRLEVRTAHASPLLGSCQLRFTRD